MKHYVFNRLKNGECSPNIELSWLVREHIRKRPTPERMRRLSLFAELACDCIDGTGFNATPDGARMWSSAFAIRIAMSAFE